MKLSDCTLGRMVITQNKKVGHVVGLTYNIALEFTGGLTPEELLDRTIPLVRFPDIRLPDMGRAQPPNAACTSQDWGLSRRGRNFTATERRRDGRGGAVLPMFGFLFW